MASPFEEVNKVLLSLYYFQLGDLNELNIQGHRKIL